MKVCGGHGTATRAEELWEGLVRMKETSSDGTHLMRDQRHRRQGTQNDMVCTSKRWGDTPQDESTMDRSSDTFSTNTAHNRGRESRRVVTKKASMSLNVYVPEAKMPCQCSPMHCTCTLMSMLLGSLTDMKQRIVCDFFSWDSGRSAPTVRTRSCALSSPA